MVPVKRDKISKQASFCTLGKGQVAIIGLSLSKLAVFLILRTHNFKYLKLLNVANPHSGAINYDKKSELIIDKFKKML